MKNDWFPTYISIILMCILLFFYFSPNSPDAISDRNPRVIDDARARKLASDLKRCSYYETCATYGLNVECVFQDGTFLIIFQVNFVSH